jgi:CubicO group peptidase (beta-lactamase class C family)
LVGAAVADGHLRLDQPLSELLPAETRALEAEKRAITVEDLVTMRAGLGSTSFGEYGAWVSSRNWVRSALERPLVAPRGANGGPMIYSTGSTHLLSAALTRATGMSTLRYARERLLEPLGITARPWTADPQGIYLGGNEMAMTPRELLAFGNLYLHRGRAPDGRQVLPEAWIDSSWVSRGTSPWSGDGYGYGWWIRRAPAQAVYYAWGYGGQMVFVVPPLELVVVMTSDAYSAREGGHVEALRRMVTDEIVPAVAAVR